MKSGGVISQSLLFKLNTDMAFQSSPLVCAAQLGYQDLVHLMMKIFQFEVDYSEECTGLNALAAAVQTKNKRMIKYLVKEMGANINEKLTLVDEEGDTLQCTPFILVMFQPSGPELMGLPTKLGADLHHRFLTDGLQSLINNIVLKQNNKENSSKILSKLLSHGFKLDHPLWDNLGNPFHCHLPLELAIRFQARDQANSLWHPIVQDLTDEAVCRESEALKNLSLPELAYPIGRGRIAAEMVPTSHQ